MTLPLLSPDDLPEPPSPAQAAQSMAAGKPRLGFPSAIRLRCAGNPSTICSKPTIRRRIVWAAVLALDLKSWLNEIKAIERHVGRDATDPRLLVALWVFATLKGIGSVRTRPAVCGVSAVPVALRRGERQLSHVVRLSVSRG